MENEKPFGLMSKEMQDKANDIEVGAFQIYNCLPQPKAAWETVLNGRFQLGNVYRLRPDYEQEPEVVKHLNMKYFVLKPEAKSKHDAYASASQSAMCTYADNIREIDPDFAREISQWAQGEAVKQARL